MMVTRLATMVTIACVLAFAAPTALAQDATTGAVRGEVKDVKTGQPVAAASVVAEGPALQGTQTALADETGQYFIANLPPGVYQITVFYALAQTSRTNVVVALGKTAKVNLEIDTQATTGEAIVIQGSATLIDQQSTKVGNTLRPEYSRNVPTGRVFSETLGATGGTQGDFHGTSMLGSSSLENMIVLEGMNTTDPATGVLTSNTSADFIAETELITGGYNAEYGRSTGGVINVVTKSGSNEFHGSVFSAWQPGAISPRAIAVPRAGSSIDRESNLAYDADVGAEVGGPIIKDRLWFHVGVNPNFRQTNLDRVIKSQVDENGDGVPDSDERGFRRFETLDRHRLNVQLNRHFYTGKLSGAVSPDHQGSLALIGHVRTQDDLLNLGGSESAMWQETDRDVNDVIGRWRSKFNDNKTQVEVVVGHHSDIIDRSPRDVAGSDGAQISFDRGGPQGSANAAYSLMDFAGTEEAFGGVPEACVDGGPDDPYPMIINCPAPGYKLGGAGIVADSDARRLSAGFAVTQRATLLKQQHVFKGGFDYENQTFSNARYYTGGALYRERFDSQWSVSRFFTLGSEGDTPCFDLDADGVGDLNCRQVDVQESDTRTRNFGAYVQDSWSVLPNLIANIGVRWDHQKIYAARQIQGRASPLTGNPIPKQAFELGPMFSPRLGVMYDWTREGRSKAYASWGRFFESMPMAVNARAYGGEVGSTTILPVGTCSGLENITSCDESMGLAPIFTGGETLATPGLKPQFMDEIIVGTDYEVLPDLKVGLSFIRRDLKRAVEDVSVDGRSFVIANPGEAVDPDVIQSLRQQAMDEENPELATKLDARADAFENVGLFNKPRRTYNAVQLTTEYYFTKNFSMAGSYTLSKLRGNHTGLFADNGALEPNMTKMYNALVLQSNLYGDLIMDKPHILKVDAFYRLNLKQIGFFIFGLRGRTSSGEPINYRGSHPVVGANESFILPRGSGGDTPMNSRIDFHVSYGRELRKGIELEAYVDLFNPFNWQPEARVDTTYTSDAVNPISGGTTQDLVWAKKVSAVGEQTPDPVTRNENFRNTTIRQGPFAARFGVRLLF